MELILYQVTLASVCLAVAVAIPFGGPLRRCGLILGLAQALCWYFEIEAWHAKLAIDLVAMIAVMWKPAGSLQAIIGGLFLAAAVKHLAFGMSGQSYNAALVGWWAGISITLTQVVIILAGAGGSLGERIGIDGSALRRGMVSMAAWADGR